MSASASRSSGTTSRRRAEALHVGRGLRRIARSHGDQLQPVDAGIQCARQLQADCTEPADRDRLPHAFRLRDGTRQRQILRRVDVEEGVPFRNSKINPTHADRTGEVGDVAPAVCRQQLAQVVAAGDRPERDQMVQPARCSRRRRAGERGRQRALAGRTGYRRAPSATHRRPARPPSRGLPARPPAVPGRQIRHPATPADRSAANRAGSPLALIAIWQASSAAMIRSIMLCPPSSSSGLSTPPIRLALPPARISGRGAGHCMHAGNGASNGT